MSSTKLKNLAGRIEGIFAANLRKEFEKLPGQLFIINLKRTKKLINFGFKKAGLPTEDAQKAYQFIVETLDAIQDRVPSEVRDRAEEFKLRIKEGKTIIPANHEIYVVRNYRQIQEAKTKVGKKIEELSAGKITAGQITGKQFGGSNLKDLSGDQIGHGQYGSAIAGIKSQQVEQELLKFNDGKNDFTDLISKIETLREQYKITTVLTHDMVFDANGKFRKRFTAITSSQSARLNQYDSKQEAAFLREIENLMKEEVYKIKGSPSLEDAATAGILYNLTKSRNKKVKAKGPIKPAKKTKSSGRGKTSGTNIEEKSQVSIISGTLLPDDTKRKRRVSKGVSSSPLALMSLLNAALPEVITKNMGSPALNYISGRFASSVKVTDITPTGKGFPSIGYTYMLYPYQTFEPGYAQGSVERDPRRLIDRSIREIAAAAVIGKFYTRRV